MILIKQLIVLYAKFDNRTDDLKIEHLIDNINRNWNQTNYNVFMNTDYGA